MGTGDDGPLTNQKSGERPSPVPALLPRSFLQGGLDQNALQQAPVDGPEPLEGAEVGGPEQGGWLGQFHRPAIRQKPSHKLGAEKVVPPLEGQVKIAGERPKHTVMVLSRWAYMA